MNSKSFITPLLATVLLTALCTPVHADRGIPWSSLSRDEQSVLQKHQRNWSAIPADEQSRLLKGARKYLDLPQDKRNAVVRQREQYQQMPPDERNRLRQKYREEKRYRSDR